MQENLIFKKLQGTIDMEVRKDNVVNVYTTKILDVAPETISVAAPTEEGRMVPLAGGTRVKLLVPEGSVVFMFDSIIVGAKVDEHHPVLILQKPVRMEKAQRRNSFRVPTEEFPVKASVLTGGTTEPFEGICKEVSGGGMMLVANPELASGINLELTFQLPGEPEVFDVIGEVKRVEHMKRGTIYEFRFGIFFSNISDRMREKIIKYTFRQQRKLIQRGLL